MEVFTGVCRTDSVMDTSGYCSRRFRIACLTVGATISTIMLIAILVDAIHLVPEGSVAVYYRHGALRETTVPAGVHITMPFVTNIVEVTVRTETATLPPVRCVTKDGIENTFYNVQVMSNIRLDKLIMMIRTFGTDFKRVLVYDRIAEELRTFCARREIDDVYNKQFIKIVGEVMTGLVANIKRLGYEGIEIFNLAIPKPDIPPDIAHNYKEVKVKWTLQLVASQEHKTAMIHKKTEAMKAIEDAERQKAVVTINITRETLEAEGARNISKLNDQILKARDKSRAESHLFKVRQEATANRDLFTDKYVKLNLAKSLTNNTKLYFSGVNSLLGKILEETLGKFE